MNTLSKLARSIIRFIVVWFIDTISLLITAWILPSVNLLPVNNYSTFVIATVAAFLLGVINFIIRPLLLLVTLPLGWMATFLLGFFLNGIVLWIAGQLMAGLDVIGFWGAFFGGLFLSFINTILTTILAIDDEDSFYENLVQRQALRQAGKIEPGEGRGLVMLETDGLSYQRIKKAIEEGWMPTLKMMMDEEGYQLSRVDCGVPPTTPACQAGILQGNNTGIPAFRWLDKKTGRILAGGQAAAEIEPILSDGNGLLRGGSSIGNMFSGDAAKALLTFSKMKTGTPEDKRQRSRDMYMLMRNPYFITRVLVLYFGDIFLELWQGWQQKRRDERPRLNRLHNGYPFLRSAATVFMRDIGTYFTILDILRGVPAIYTLYFGYDEVAHHSGPYTRDASLVLQQFDKQVARIKRVIEEKAKRPFELLLLSDHGQSYGDTFEQRYGMTVLEFIQQQLPKETSVTSSGGGDNGSLGVSAMLNELENMQEQKQGGRVGKTAIQQASRVINKSLSQQDSFQEAEPAKVTFCYGGNGGLVYFDLAPRKLTLNELNAAYPGMVDNLTKHEGIGFVIGYDDDLVPVAFGKNGARNLRTGDIVGEDPLLPYGDTDLRAWQLGRMADFENAGDLILNSTMYPDGTVAAMEELVGNHGGLGGEQTDAYLFHPGDMQVPTTRGSFEFKDMLDSRRGLIGSTPKPIKPATIPVNPWAISTLITGLTQPGKWLGLAARSITLSKDAFIEIAADPFMTGPALLIALVAQGILAFVRPSSGNFVFDFILRFGLWIIALVFLQLTTRFLRGKAKSTTTFRVAGFAQSAHFLELLSFLPVIGPIARFLSVVVTLIAVWVGTTTAHEMRGWRTLLLPLIYLLVTIMAVVFITAILRGAALTYQQILTDLGITTQP